MKKKKKTEEEPKAQMERTKESKKREHTYTYVEYRDKIETNQVLNRIEDNRVRIYMYVYI